MPIELTVTAKGRVTLRQAVLDHRGVGPGGKVGASLLPDGRVELTSAAAGHHLRDVRGTLRPPPVTRQRGDIDGAASRDCRRHRHMNG